MFAKVLQQGEHTRRFSITERGRDGWEIREEHDDAILKQARYTDWHRVERDLARFTREIAELHRQGWRDAQDS